MHCVTKINPLKYKHLVDMLYPAWELAFTEERNRKGWRNEGLIPFTQHELWKYRATDKGSGTCPCPVTTSTATAVDPSCDPLESKDGGTTIPPSSKTATAAPPTTEGSAAVRPAVPLHLPGIPLPPTSSSMPTNAPLPVEMQDALRVASRTLNTRADVTAASLATQESLLPLVERNLLVEDLLGKFCTYLSQLTAVDDVEADDDGVQDVDDEARGGRITAKDLWHLQGSATGEQALAIARTKHEERKRKQEQAAANREEREAKRRATVAMAITKSVGLLQHISTGGPGAVKQMKVQELQWLLMQSTQDKAPKGTKAELLAKVGLLPDVKKALAEYTRTSTQQLTSQGAATATMEHPSPTAVQRDQTAAQQAEELSDQAEGSSVHSFSPGEAVDV